MNDFKVMLQDLTDEQKANREFYATIELVRPDPIESTDEVFQSIQEDLHKIMEHATDPYMGTSWKDNAGDMSNDIAKALGEFLSTDKRFKQGA